MIKLLFIGGTGNISSSVSRLCIEKGFTLTLLNRGKTAHSSAATVIPGAEVISADINDVEAVEKAIAGREWDAVVNFIAFTPEDVRRDIELFRGKTAQYVYISSSSVYQKPPVNYIIRESTPLYNPYWDYAAKKLDGEEVLVDAMRYENFPFTIVRPAHTYNITIPIPIGASREYTAIDRMHKGKPVIVPGDGTSLWTLTHADDFAVGFTGLLGNPRAIGQAYHITSDEVFSWNEIYQMIGAAAGVKPNLVHIPSDLIAHEAPSLAGTLLGDKMYSSVFDNSKIKQLVPEFVCKIPFHVGIRRTLAWFDQDTARKVIMPETNDMIDKIINRYLRVYTR